MQNKATVIACVNQKGGTGKTCTAENLGIGMVQEGKKVLLVDMDPQASLTISLGYPRPDDLPVTVSDQMAKVMQDMPIPLKEGILTHEEGVDLMPASIALSGLEVSLVNAMSRESVLKQYLEPLKKEYDFIILDCIVRDMTDDEATVLMVDSNLQRESILPSERAFAYKMKLDALNHQGQHTSVQVEQKQNSRSKVAQETGQSEATVFRFIRLTNLIPDLLEMVDQKQISFNPAVELSYLKPEEQEIFMEAMDLAQTAPSLSQAQRMKKLSQEGGFTLDAVREIMTEVKKGDLERVTFRNETLRKYFPKSYSTQQMQDTIIKLLEQWQKRKQRDQGR